MMLKQSLVRHMTKHPKCSTDVRLTVLGCIERVLRLQIRSRTSSTPPPVRSNRTQASD